jgi:hypothetical protein
MAKRRTGLGKRRRVTAKKTKKRLAIKADMLANKKKKKGQK